MFDSLSPAPARFSVVRRILERVRLLFGGWRRHPEPSSESKRLADVLQPVRRRG